MDITKWSCRTCQSGVRVCIFQCSSQSNLHFITAVLSRVARYLRFSHSHVCREEGTLWGKDQKASFLPAAFKVVAKKQPKWEEKKKHPTKRYLEPRAWPLDILWRPLTQLSLMKSNYFLAQNRSALSVKAGPDPFQNKSLESSTAQISWCYEAINFNQAIPTQP